MEFNLDSKSKLQGELFAIAATFARDSEALCADVSAMIFPTASVPPSEEMLAGASTKLVTLVRSIEMRLLGTRNGETGEPSSWPLLARSGFLREPELIDFVLARLSEDRLDARISDVMGDEPSSHFLPGKLLDHADPHIADAAQSLLAANSLHRKSAQLAYHELRPELLHQLCWRVVAALEVSTGTKNPSSIDAAKELLAEYDENSTTRTAASKLAHFLQDELAGELLDPRKAGSHLFVASVAARLALDHDHVLRLIDAPSAAPLAILLHGCDLEREDAMEIIYLVKGFGLTPRDVAFFDRVQGAVTAAEARAEAGQWAIARTQQLFGSQNG